MYVSTGQPIIRNGLFSFFLLLERFLLSGSDGTDPSLFLFLLN